MFYNDHAPPHFHAAYGDDEAIFAIDSLQILRGGLPRRARALVVEWAESHRDELLNNWDLARSAMPLVDIEPLE